MSRTIDQRIVEMQFLNNQFEKGVQESLRSIEKLKSGLGSLEGSGQSFTAVADAADGMKVRIDAMSIVVMTTISRLTDAFIDFGIQSARALTMEPAVSGFRAYEMQINAVNAIMNATQRPVEEVEGALASLIFFADETSFSFNQMIDSVKLFTGAGIILEDAVTAMQGIGSASALAGVPMGQMETVFDALSKSIGMGALRLNEWNRLQRAGLGTSIEFKEILLATAVEMGTLVETEHGFVTATADSNGRVNEAVVNLGNLSTTLSENWATTEVLMTVFGRFGEFADEVFSLVQKEGILASQAINVLSEETRGFSERGFRAAQEARTLTDALEAVSGAITARWRTTWGLLIGNVDEATELWTDFTEVLWDLTVTSGDARNSLLSMWRGVEEGDIDGRTILLEGIVNIGRTLIAIIETIQDAWRTIFPPMTAERLLDMTIGFRNFTERLIMSEATIDKLSRTFTGLFAVLDIFRMIISGVFNVFGQILGAIFPSLGSGILSITAVIGDLIVGLRDIMASADIFSWIGENIIDGLIIGVSSGLRKAIDAIVALARNIWEAFRNFFLIKSPSELMEAEGTNIVDGVALGIRGAIGNAVGAIKDLGAAILSAFNNFLNETVIGGAVKSVADVITTAFSGTLEFLRNVGSLVSDAIQDIGKRFLEFLGLDISPFEKFIMALEFIFRPFALIIDGIKWLVEGVVDIFKALAPVVQTISGHLKTLFAPLGAMIAESFSEGITISNILSFVNAVLTGGLIASISGFVRELRNTLRNTESPINELTQSIINTLSGVKAVLIAYQQQIKAEALFTIAKAVGLLTVSLLVLASIPLENLRHGMVAMTILFGGLASVSLALGKGMALLQGVKASSTVMAIGASILMMAVGLRVLASALRAFEAIDMQKAGKDFHFLAAGIAMIGLGLHGVKASSLLAFGIAIGLIALSLIPLAIGLKAVSMLDPLEIAKGVGTLGVVLTSMGLAANLIDKGKIIGLGVAFAIISGSLIMLALGLKAISMLDFADIVKGIGTLGFVLLAIASSSKTINEAKIIKIAGALGIISASLLVLGVALKFFGDLGWGDIAKGLVTMGAMMKAVYVASKIDVTKFMKFGAALLKVGLGMLAIGAGIAAIGGGLYIFMLAIAELSEMSWIEFADGMGKAIIVIGLLGGAAFLAGKFLAPFGLSLAMIGVAMLGVGAGLLLAAKGVNALADANWDDIGKAAVVMGIILAGLLVAALLAPKIIILSAALIKLGIALVIIGAGLVAIGIGIAMIKGNFDTLWEVLGGAVQAIVDVAKRMWEAFKNFFRIKSPSELMEEEGGNIILGIIQGLFAGIKAVVDAIKEVGRKLWEGFKNFFRIRSPSELMEEEGGSIIGGIIKGLLGGIAGIIEVVGKIGGAILGGIRNVVGKAGEIAGNIVGGIRDGLASGVESIGSAARNIGSAISNGIGTAVDKVGDIMGAIGAGVQNGMQAVGGWVSGIGSTIVEGGSNAVDKIGDVAGSIVDTLGTGLQNGVSAVGNAARNVGDSITNGINSALRRNSPPEAILDIAYAVGDALICGLDDMVDSVTDASEDLGDNLLKGLKKSLEDISDIIDHDLDLTPTIRPVIDMRDIEDGLQHTFDHPRTLDVSDIKGRVDGAARAMGADGRYGDISTSYDEQEVTIVVNNYVRNDNDIHKINRGLDNTISKFARTRGVPAFATNN